MFRIVFFSISYIDFIYESPSWLAICTLEILQNIPVILMYYCYSVFHAFLLRIYIILKRKDTAKNRRYINIYLIFWFVLLFLSEIM